MVDLNPLIPYAIGGVAGSIVTGLFTWVKDHYGKKQQFRLDIIKNRLEVFSKLSNDYILLASALHEFHEIALSDEVPNERKFYYTCKFFFYYSKIAEEAGGFEFENRLSEEVVTFLVSDIINVLSESGFNYEAFSTMIDLVTSDDGKSIRYNKFIPKIDKNVFSKFESNVISNEQRYGNLMQYCKWLEKIMVFEINRAFRFYYNESPEFESDVLLVKYLILNGFGKYVKRLKSSNKSRVVRFFELKGNNY